MQTLVIFEIVMNRYRFWLMGSAMIFLVIFHQPWFDNPICDFFHRTGQFGVEVFLFVSGWGIFHSLCRNSLKKYYKNRLFRLMPVTIFIGIIQTGLDLLGCKGGPDHPLGHLLMCVGFYKWFIIAIFIYYLIAPILLWILTKSRIFSFLLLLISIGLSFVCNYFEPSGGSVFITTLPVIVYRFPSFLFGMIIAKYYSYWDKQKLYFSAFCLLVFLFASYTSFFSPYTFVCQSISITFAVPIFFYLTPIVVSLFPAFINKAIAAFGISSLEIYLWHEYWFRGISTLMDSYYIMQIILAGILTIIFVFVTRKMYKVFSLWIMK